MGWWRGFGGGGRPLGRRAADQAMVRAGFDVMPEGVDRPPVHRLSADLDRTAASGRRRVTIRRDGGAGSAVAAVRWAVGPRNRPLWRPVLT